MFIPEPVSRDVTEVYEGYPAIRTCSVTEFADLSDQLEVLCISYEARIIRAKRGRRAEFIVLLIDSEGPYGVTN